MSKIKVNTDIIANNVLPKTNEVINSLSNAQNVASSIEYPYGEFEWSSIRGKIDNCMKEMKKYKTSTENLHDGVKSILTNLNDELEEIKIDSIKSLENGVK